MKRIIPLLIITLLLISCSSLLISKSQDISDEGKEILLKERVQTLWEGMVKRDRGLMYDMYDPFFRINVNKMQFVGMNMPIYYFNPELKLYEIKGNVARINVKVEYEVRGVKLHGKEVKEPRKETVTTETWLFIDDNWYRQYVDNLSEASLVKY